MDRQIPKLTHKNFLTQLGWLPSLLLFFVTGGAFVGYLVVNFQYVKDQVLWRDYFKGGTPIGNQCEFSVQPWAGSFAATMQSLGELRPIILPHRGQDNSPLVYEADSLYARCRIDLTKVPKIGFAWLYLGPIFGESQIALDGRVVASTLGRNQIELPVPESSRGQVAVLEILSRGDKYGAVGMASLVPPFVTQDAAVLKKVRRFMEGLEAEQALSHMILALVFLLIFTGIWQSGLHYHDLRWIIIFTGSICLLYFVRYSVFLGILDFPWLRQVRSALYFLAVGSQIMFFVNYVRLKNFAESVYRYLAPFFVIVIATIFFLPEALFFRARLLVLGPSVLAVFLLTTLTLFLVTSLRKIDHPLARGRLKRAISALTVITAILLTQAILDNRYGIYLDSLTHSLTIFIFSAIIIEDILRRQREYFRERSERMESQALLRASKARIETVKYLAHDIIKPYHLIQLFLDGFKDQGDPNVLRQQAQLFLESMQRTQKNVEKTMREMIQSRGEPQQESKPYLATQVLKPIVDSFQIASTSLNIDWQVSIAPTFSIPLSAEELERVATNLLDNALRAMKAAGVQRGEILVKTESANDRSRITFYNSGTFIESGIREKIFEEEFHAGKQGHFGLGLAYVRGVVEKVGGRVTCQSDERGTSFTLDFTERKGWSREGGGSLGNVRVVLVDDDMFIGSLWRQAFSDEQMNAQLTIFESPKLLFEAIVAKELILEEVSLIIMDEHFGNDPMTGSEAAVRLRQDAGCPAVLSSSFAVPRGTVFDGVIGKASLTKDELQFWLLQTRRDL